MKTNVYIDGFNLYYRAVKGTNYKWLDLLALSGALLPSHEINRIRYFTAQSLSLPDDPNVPVRQAAYIRALGTIRNLTIHLGQFRRRTRSRPLVTPIPGLPTFVRISDFEEKGSDVNLATYLLIDGYEGDYEQAVVISNDSDLALPIAMVRDKLKFPIGIVNPNVDQSANTPTELSQAATFSRRIRRNTLRNCQFPQTLTDSNGTIRKPAGW